MVNRRIKKETVNLIQGLPFDVVLDTLYMIVEAIPLSEDFANNEVENLIKEVPLYK